MIKKPETIQVGQIYKAYGNMFVFITKLKDDYVSGFSIDPSCHKVHRWTILTQQLEKFAKANYELISEAPK